jgi:hypothetical protein
MRFQINAVLFTAALSMLLVGCQSLAPMEIRPEWRERATVHATAVQSPLDSFLYMRTGSLICAVRFSELRGKFGVPPEAKMGERMPTTATYSAICQPRGQARHIAADAVRTTGHVQFTLSRCHVSGGCNLYDVAPSAVVFGAQKYGVAWQPPNGLSYISAEVGQYFGMRRIMQLAPTAVFDERRIDFEDSKLQWFALSDSERDIKIPIIELPQ